MTACKTGAEHIKSLKDGRTVYIDGKVVAEYWTLVEVPGERLRKNVPVFMNDFVHVAPPSVVFWMPLSPVAA